jgi:hypothetical protein
MAALADFDDAGGGREQRADFVADQRVEQDDVGAFDGAESAQGEEVGSAWAGADEKDAALPPIVSLMRHCGSPGRVHRR